MALEACGGGERTMTLQDAFYTRECFKGIYILGIVLWEWMGCEPRLITQDLTRRS